MRTVIQRVKRAKVEVSGEIIGEIEQGLLLFLAIHEEDTEDKIAKMAEKIIKLRIFSDREDKMNLSLLEAGGDILVVSQFTLYGNCEKGNRPSFIKSARPDKGRDFYDKFIEYLRQKDLKVATGEFGAMMDVEILNDGPVTLILDL